MDIKVITRNGSSVEYNPHRIFNALKNAFTKCGYNLEDSKISEIVSEVQIWNEITIEELQDQVEELLMDFEYNDVAKEYILYRHERSIIRQQQDSLMKQVASKLEANNVQNQNANIDEYSFGGRIGEASRAVTKEYALRYCMSNMSKLNHENNEIYIHDLDSYAVGMHNCLSIPFDELLASGFNTRQTDVRPANSVNTAFQLIAVIFQLQSLQQFGR